MVHQGHRIGRSRWRASIHGLAIGQMFAGSASILRLGSIGEQRERRFRDIIGSAAG